MSDQLFDHVVREWLDAGSDRTPPPAIDAVLLAVKTTPQERDLRIPRRFSQMPNSMRLAAGITLVVIAGAVGLTTLTRSPGPGSGPSPEPSPTAIATRPTASIAATQASLGPIDTATWVTYTSSRYQFSIGHPADWSEHPADHVWTLAADAKPLALDTGAERFSSTGDTVRVTAWSVVVTPGTTTDSWLQAYCPLANEPCAMLATNTFAVTVDGHAGSLVTFGEDVQAFVLASNRMYVVAVWRPDGHSTTLAYGGGHRLLEGFLSTMHLLP